MWREELLTQQKYFSDLEKCGVDFRLKEQFKKKEAQSAKGSETAGVFRKLNTD